MVVEAGPPPAFAVEPAFAVPVPEAGEPVDEAVPVHGSEADAEDDEPQMIVKSVDTVSAIDLIMAEDEPADADGAGNG